jgi:hypothetical protein
MQPRSASDSTEGAERALGVPSTFEEAERARNVMKGSVRTTRRTIVSETLIARGAQTDASSLFQRQRLVRDDDPGSGAIPSVLETS